MEADAIRGRLGRRLVGKFLQLPVTFALFLFLPAGTLDYWQGWLFVAVFCGCSVALTAYLWVRDPKLLESRLDVGPRAEKEKAQRVIMRLLMLAFAALFIVPGLDRRFGWSRVPAAAVLAADLLLLAAYFGLYIVFRENSYGASTIRVTEGQRVIKTGPYGVVRHPMYSCALILVLAIPIALGSWWGLLLFPPVAGVIVWRLLEEERFLTASLAGYDEYRSEVCYRIIPGFW